ncbi:hypothetical protein, partial [Rhizobium leguminosarum]|uniref:hypothetical protein n=1 Tax=Rhizobium leguminosarum TaxID=384 RepID=UPI003F9843EA
RPLAPMRCCRRHHEGSQLLTPAGTSRWRRTGSEPHFSTVGSDQSNLILSDQRAESFANVLTLR